MGRQRAGLSISEGRMRRRLGRRDVPQGYADMEARLLSGDAFKRAVIDIVKELLLEMFSPILHLHKK